jgi:two-component system NarL family response regulator
MPRFAAKAMLKESSDLDWVGEASSPAEAIHQASRLRPDIVLMDVEMPESSGPELTKQLLVQFPNLKIVAWTVSDAPEDLLSMIGAGCVGYVLKDVGPDELRSAILAAVKNETPVPRRMIPEILTRASSQHMSRPASSVQVHLTGRENDVLRLLAKGEPIKQIARGLGISVTSVNTHVRGIYGKLGASARGEAVSLALRAGVISLSDM